MKSKKPQITQARLHELFHYDGNNLIRRNNVPQCKSGDVAGYVDKSNGYRKISVDNKVYYSHRLIWLYVYGRLPKKNIDHVNGDKLNNCIDNLRDVDQMVNLRNARKQKSNTSGFTGVSWHKETQKWRGYIFVMGKSLHLGLFDCRQEAAKARKQAEFKYGFSERHGA